MDARFLKRQTDPVQEQQWLQWVSPDCPDLNHYLQEHGEQYEALFFVAYLYATTTRTLPSVRQPSILIPTAHDEPPIYGRFFDSFFYQPFRLFLCSQKEKEFLTQRTAPAPVDFHWEQHPVVSVGVDLPELGGWAPLSQLPEHYFLYVGRIQKEKSVDELLDGYLDLPAAFRKKYPLVLIGRANISIPADPTVIPLGFVSEEVKARALRFCSLFILPSQFESLSLSLLEAWSFQRPCLVKEDRPSSGSLRTKSRWLAYICHADFIKNPKRRWHYRCHSFSHLDKGRLEYVRSQYTWDKAEALFGHVKAAREHPWRIWMCGTPTQCRFSESRCPHLNFSDSAAINTRRSLHFGSGSQQSPRLRKTVFWPSAGTVGEKR